MTDISLLHGQNAAFLDDLYRAYQDDPRNVPEEWQKFFSGLGKAESKGNEGRPEGALSQHLSDRADEQVKVLYLINANRYRGHREADLDPLRLHERPRVPDLRPEYYGFGESDMAKVFNTGSLFGGAEAKLSEIIALLEATYRGSIGTEITHITSTEQKRWIQERLESARGRPSYSAEKKRDILRWTTSARKLEDYLHRKYVGQKRFSLEGAENLIPCMDEIVQRAGEQKVQEVIIGMAHRGRLNVLVNILGKHPKVLFGEFEGKIDVGTGSGDVKYHLGFSSDVETPGGPVHLVLAFNPSHLEIINPVVEGSVRARQERREDNERNEVLPVLVHGDAAFAGQGVVTETLNLSETRGYGTGGTVHVVVNNQIGFTTSDPLDSRSTLYCTDVAKLVQAPIFHVNGNDAEAVVFVTALALDFRMRFNKDVVIDIVCFRRYGHNESDEPLATQPMMYKKIKQQKGPRQLYGEQLVAEGVMHKGEPEKLSEEYLKALEENKVVARPPVKISKGPFVADWSPYVGTHWRDPAKTAVSMKTVEELGLKMTEHPDDFELNRSVKRIIDARRDMAKGDRAMDWGFAENLAYATLLKDGFSIRLSGQDSQRGTFFHRHAVLHNQKNTYTTASPDSALSTRCCRKRPCSVSNSASAPPSPRVWSSGRPSSVISPTAPRSSSTSS
jgi:2-oxoglutarate dehydrogenase E1 component